MYLTGQSSNLLNNAALCCNKGWNSFFAWKPCKFLLTAPWRYFHPVWMEQTMALSLLATNLNATHFTFSTFNTIQVHFESLRHHKGTPEKKPLPKLNVLHIKMKIWNKTRDKVPPCQHTDLESFDKCRVCRVTDPKTPYIISHQDKWQNLAVSLFYFELWDESLLRYLHAPLTGTGF